MTARNYTSSAPATTLSGGITNVAASLTVASSSGYPTAPFVAIIDRDGAGEEAVLVTNVGGTTWTVTRGYDGTTALSHLSGVSVEHGVTAIEFREANTHVNASSDVHGVSGGLKSYIDTADAVHPALVSGVHGVTGNLKTYIDSGNTHASATTGVHGVTGSIETRLAATESTATSANSTATTHVALTSGVHGVSGNLKDYIDTGTPARYCHILQTAAQSIPDAAATDLQFNDLGWDTLTWRATGGGKPDRIAPPVGKYIVSASVQWNATSVVGARAIYLYLKGNAGTVDYLIGAATCPGNIGAVGLTPSLSVSGTHVIASTSDYFYVKVYQNSGAALSTIANSVHVTCSFIGA